MLPTLLCHIPQQGPAQVAPPVIEEPGALCCVPSIAGEQPVGKERGEDMMGPSPEE